MPLVLGAWCLNQCTAREVSKCINFCKTITWNQVNCQPVVAGIIVNSVNMKALSTLSGIWKVLRAQNDSIILFTGKKNVHEIEKTLETRTENLNSIV